MSDVVHKVDLQAEIYLACWIAEGPVSKELFYWPAYIGFCIHYSNNVNIYKEFSILSLEKKVCASIVSLVHFATVLYKNLRLWLLLYIILMHEKCWSSSSKSLSIVKKSLPFLQFGRLPVSSSVCYWFFSQFLRCIDISRTKSIFHREVPLGCDPNKLN